MVAMMIAMAMRMTTKKSVATALTIGAKMKMMITSDDGAKEDNADRLDGASHVPGTVASALLK